LFSLQKIPILFLLLFLPLSATWKTELVNSGADERLNQIIYHSSGNLIAIGDEMTVIYSEDNGESWDEGVIPNIRGWVNEDELMLSSICEIPGSGELIMTLVENEIEQSNTGGPDFDRRTAILSSNDRGKTWKVIGTFDNAALFWTFVFSDNQCVLIGASNDIYEYKNHQIRTFAENPLRNLEMISTVEFEYFWKIRFDGSEKITQHHDSLFLRRENDLFVSPDRGRSWIPIGRKPLNVSITTAALHNQKTIVAGCDNGIILISENQGHDWIAGKISKYDINGISVSNQKIWCASGDNGFLGYSLNLGKSWTPIKTNCEDDLYNITMNPTGTEAWICGDEGTLVHLYECDTSRYQLINNVPDKYDSAFIGNQKQNQPDVGFMVLGKNDSLMQGIFLSVGPGTCTITIDDHTLTGELFKIQLPAGEHSFQISKEGYFSVTEKVDIQIGEIEEEEITLRKVKAQVAPSAGFSIKPLDWSFNVSIVAGILTCNNNSTGLEINGDVFFTHFTEMLSISAYYGYKFDINEYLSLFPTLSVGGSIWLEDTNTSTSDSSYAFSNKSSSDDSEPDVRGTGFFLQASVNMIYKKSDRWGFIFRPSVAWVGNRGFQFIMRLGSVVWI
jgi:photosystem II stability/assembly factor-like uncharacterized protein